MRLNHIFFCCSILVLAFILTFLSGCTQGHKPVSEVLGREFHLKIGQQAVFPEEKINVLFVNITADSRCPKKAQCIRAGEVEALLRIIVADHGFAEYNLIVGIGDGAQPEKRFGDYSIRVVYIEPFPSLEQTSKISDYVAVFLIKRL